MEDSDGFKPSIAFANSTEADNSVIILASFDFFYYHNLEMVFYNVAFNDIQPRSQWWDHWKKDQIELADEAYDEGFKFKFNRGGENAKCGIIIARGFSYLFQQVSHRIR